MTLAQLTQVIDEAAACGVETVYFEGGEPTLAYPVVLAAAKHARERGLEWGMVSNCFWATSPEDARLWLEPFVELGISDLSLSSYAYFVEDADEDRLRNAVAGGPGPRPADGRARGRRGRLPRRAGALPRRGRRRDHVQGQGGRRARPRPSGAAARDARLLPLRGLRRPRPRPHRLRRRAADLPGRQRRQRLRGPAASRPCSTRTILLRGPSSARSAPAARGRSRGEYGHTPARELYADECHLCYEVRSALRARVPEVLAPAQCYGQST